MDDYGGGLVPNLQFSDFSKDTLVKLLELYGKFFRALDGFWYLSVKEHHGNDEALACDIDTWQRLCPYEMEKLAEVMNIRGNDVPAAMKAIQLNPWLQQTKFTMEIENSRYGVLTVTKCPTLEALEREGNGRETEICNQVDPIIFQDYARYFNKDIRVTCLKSPPRDKRSDVCCRWAFALP
jgi:uncharacterized protein DUF6125